MEYQASLIFENELTPKQGVKIPAGIHAAAEVTSIERGDNFVDINVKDAEGRTHNKRLWDANGNYPRKDPKTGQLIETKQEAFEREEKTNLAHLLLIMYIFNGKEAIANLPKLDYDEMVERIIKEVTPKLKTKKVNIKLIYDSENKYSTFGTFPGRVNADGQVADGYIEPYIQGQEPTLKFSAWELANRSGAKSDDAPKTGSALADLLNQ